MVILGIDPGFGITGYGLININGAGNSGIRQKMQIIEAGVLRTSKNGSLGERLHEIYQQLTEILKEFSPEVMAVEDTYSIQSFPKSAIYIGYVQGVVLLAAAQNSIPVYHYYARQIKKALVGSGTATKSQVQRMVQMTFDMPQPPKPDDIADALAVAICHANRMR